MGSTIDAPVPIPCDEEDEQRETNLKLNPLSRLKKPPKTNYTAQIIDEECNYQSRVFVSERAAYFLEC